MSATGYRRVYEKHGAYWFVDRDGKWHRLCDVTDGEPAMLRALAKHKQGGADKPGSMLALVDDWRKLVLPSYSEDVQKDYGYMLAKIEFSFRDVDVRKVTSHLIMDFRDHWEDKPRTAQKYQGLMSVLMTYAIRKRLITVNPCRDVPKLKPKPRRRYMSNDEMLKIVEAAVKGRRHSGHGKEWTNANGEMYELLFEFAYLTGLRAKDCRALRWSDVEEHEIIVQPTKTRESSGARIAIEITSDIRKILDRGRSIMERKAVISPFVFHTLTGGEFTKEAVKTAWRRACDRAFGPLKNGERPWFRDLRPKALSDAKRRGVTLDALKDAAGHANVSTTEGYLRGFETKDAKLGLTMPIKRKDRQ